MERLESGGIRLSARSLMAAVREAAEGFVRNLAVSDEDTVTGRLAGPNGTQVPINFRRLPDTGLLAIESCWEGAFSASALDALIRNLPKIALGGLSRTTDGDIVYATKLVLRQDGAWRHGLERCIADHRHVLRELYSHLEAARNQKACPSSSSTNHPPPRREKGRKSKWAWPPSTRLPPGPSGEPSEPV